MRNQTLFYVTAVIHLFVAIGAIPAGIAFILKPDGSLLSMSVEILQESPFQSYLIPGIVLFSVIGIGSLIAAVLTYKRQSGTWRVTIFLGIVLIIWITVQVHWIGVGSWLQPLFFFDWIAGNISWRQVEKVI